MSLFVRATFVCVGAAAFEGRRRRWLGAARLGSARLGAATCCAPQKGVRPDGQSVALRTIAAAEECGGGSSDRSGRTGRTPRPKFHSCFGPQLRNEFSSYEPPQLERRTATLFSAAAAAAQKQLSANTRLEGGRRDAQRDKTRRDEPLRPTDTQKRRRRCCCGTQTQAAQISSSRPLDSHFLSALTRFHRVKVSKHTPAACHLALRPRSDWLFPLAVGVAGGSFPRQQLRAPVETCATERERNVF